MRVFLKANRKAEKQCVNKKKDFEKDFHFKIPDNRPPGCLTRSQKKILDNYLKNFIIIELYKCMPLLGDEQNIPNWVIHAAHYCAVYPNTSNCKG
ncbi:unnamed protein product [Parnassius apollo]|uniref:(apollo) hypothetical protein n=1 Tax=Parnassius apollo TaxID=110799 RepID=A0A8S3W7L6_PARAO|nr:unnamed protein product [Parnassius apollo]